MWGKALEEFEIYQLASNCSNKTIFTRRQCIEQFCKAVDKSLNKITTGDLLKHLARTHFRTGQQLAPRTKDSERAYFKAFFRFTTKAGFTTHDPAMDLPKIRVPKSRPRPFELAQVEHILSSSYHQQTRERIILAVLTGLRIGEIVRIRGENVDLQRLELTMTRKGGKLHTIPLHPIVQHLAKNKPSKGWWFPSPYPNRLFPDGGGHILPKSGSDTFTRRIRGAGIQNGRLTGHAFRHTFATLLLREGVPIELVSELCGHENIATTQIYAELLRDDLQPAIEKLQLKVA